MSQLLTLALPGVARKCQLETSRGFFAALRAEPPRQAPDLGSVLLLPGFTGSKEDFIPILEPLAMAGYRVTAVDGCGQYETPGPPDPDRYTLTELGRDVESQILAIEAGKPIHLVGHSFGGVVARTTVLDKALTCSCASLTLVNCGPGRVATHQSDRLQLLLSAIDVMPLHEIWEFLRRDMRDSSSEINEFLRLRWLSNAPAQLASASRAMLEERDQTEELAALRLPKLVISGTPDATWPPEQLADMAQRMEARFVTVSEGGHSPSVHRPKETAAAMIDFWCASSEN